MAPPEGQPEMDALDIELRRMLRREELADALRHAVEVAADAGNTEAMLDVITLADTLHRLDVLDAALDV